MKKELFLLFLTTMLAFTALAEDESDPITSQAVFATTLRESLPELADRSHHIGLSMGASLTAGLVYEHNLNRDRRLRINYANGRTTRAFTTEDYKSAAVYTAQTDLRTRHRFVAGLDETFRPFGSRTWDLVLGLGLGYNHTEYETQFFAKVCNWLYCGFEPGKPMSTINGVDAYPFLDTRMGVRWNDIVVGGNLFEIGVFLDAVVARVPAKYEVQTPDGTKYRPFEDVNDGLFVVQTTMRL